jgi:2-polyprenyl-3-methyl-5-hydroxy-6-metoxy-1,4-benzoquinol methylase
MRLLQTLKERHMLIDNFGSFLDMLSTENKHEATFLKNADRHAEIIRILDKVDDIFDVQLLDYGAGDGILSRYLRTQGLSCFNYEPYATEDQKEYHQKHDIQFLYTKAELINNTPFGIVIFSEVIEHVAVLQPVMELIERVSTAKAKLILSTPNVMRLNMWVSFLFRRRGHPVLPVDWAVKQNDYQKHVREFTGLELRELLHFFELTDVQILFKEIDYGKRNIKEKQYLSPNIFRTVMLAIFPSFRNNIFCIASRGKK